MRRYSGAALPTHPALPVSRRLAGAHSGLSQRYFHRVWQAGGSAVFSYRLGLPRLGPSGAGGEAAVFGPFHSVYRDRAIRPPLEPIRLSRSGSEICLIRRSVPSTSA